MTRLSDLTTGSTASLTKIGGDRSFRRRLMELGLLPGTELTLVRQVKVGNVLELEVRGCHLSLRRSDAQHLFVHGQRLA
jgi:ferrous iron transport protein A